MTESPTIRETRIRRLAARLGVDIAKANDSAASSPGGGYMIVEPQTRAVILDGQTGAYSLTLDEVEAYLAEARPGTRHSGGESECGERSLSCACPPGRAFEGSTVSPRCFKSPTRDR